MEDEKKVDYVTKEEFMFQVGIVWMYIWLTLMAIISDDQGFQLALASVAALMFVVYTVYSRMLNRRKRRAKG